MIASSNSKVTTFFKVSTRQILQKKKKKKVLTFSNIFLHSLYLNIPQEVDKWKGNYNDQVLQLLNEDILQWSKSKKRERMNEWMNQLHSKSIQIEYLTIELLALPMVNDLLNGSSLSTLSLVFSNLVLPPYSFKPIIIIIIINLNSNKYHIINTPSFWEWLLLHWMVQGNPINRNY